MSGRVDRDSAHYRLGPLTTYVDAAELERRFRRAAAGERVTYAIGPAVSLSAATASLARSWHDQGLCHLLREREDGGRGFRYFLQKRHAATTKANPVSAACPIHGRPEEQLLHALVRIAEGDGVLPSLDLLAERAGLPHRQAAAYRLRLLVEGGFVQVRREGVVRYVEILKQEAGAC